MAVGRPRQIIGFLFVLESTEIYFTQGIYLREEDEWRGAKFQTDAKAYLPTRRSRQLRFNLLLFKFRYYRFAHTLRALRGLSVLNSDYDEERLPVSANDLFWKNLTPIRQVQTLFESFESTTTASWRNVRRI